MVLAWESVGVRDQMMLARELLGVRSSNHIGNGSAVLCCHGSRCESIEGQIGGGVIEGGSRWGSRVS